MRTLFLHKLFKYSKTGFAFVLMFILCYVVFFSKKIDTTFFPYNSMFTIDFNKNHRTVVYAVKIDGTPVKITHQPYWKKDFLEESLINYCKYKKNNDTGFVENYLYSKISNKRDRAFLLERLTPGKAGPNQWLPWYIKFAGYPVHAKSMIELVQYEIIYESNVAILKDSASVYKTSAF